jgi:hypothetical protein
MFLRAAGTVCNRQEDSVVPCAIVQEKQVTLKNEINAAADKTFIALIFNGVSQLLQSVTFSSRPLPWYFGAGALALTIWMIAFLIPYVLGEERIASGMGWTNAVFLEQALLLAVLAQIVVKRFLENLRDYIVDKTESAHDLVDLQRWLGYVSSKSRILWLILSFGIFWTSLAAFYDSLLWPVYQGFAVPAMAAIYATVLSLSVYYLILVIDFSCRVGHYQFRLYRFDPVNSDVIARLSHMLNMVAYAAAVGSAIGTIMIVLSGLPRIAVVGVILTGWIPVILLFVGWRSAERRLVTAEKSKTIRELQLEIEAVWQQTDRANQQCIQELTGLQDLHDRVVSTRDSSFGLRSAVTLFNQLILPIIALILSNSDLLWNLTRNWLGA